MKNYKELYLAGEIEFEAIDDYSYEWGISDDERTLARYLGLNAEEEDAWVSVGEAGDQIARTLIVDDGNYHYVLTLQAEAEKGGELSAAWSEIFQTFELGREEITKG